MRGVQRLQRRRGCMGRVLLQSVAPVGHVLCGCQGGQLWCVWRKRCVWVGTAHRAHFPVFPHRPVTAAHVCVDNVFVDMLLFTGRATVTVTLNATGVTSGNVAIDLGTDTGSTLPPATMVVGIHAIVAALGMDEGRVQGLAAGPDGPDHLSVTFLLAQSAAVSSSGDQTGTSNSSKPLSDADIVGGLVTSLRPWASLVTVQRRAGRLLEFGGSALSPLCRCGDDCALVPLAVAKRVAGEFN